MKKLKAGIIGCGKVADYHAKAYVNLDGAELVAVCGRDMGKTEQYAAKYGVKAYIDAKQMIQENDLDVVSICTPHPMHAKFAVEAAELGCNVIIEKPLAVALEDCDKIIEAADKNNVMIGSIVQRRFYRPCMRIRKAIDDGKIGTPILGTVNVLCWRGKEYYDSDPWRGTWKGEGGGVMVTQATHQIDLLLWYMGEPEEVYGVVKNLNHPYIEVEDTAVAVVKFKNGGIGNLVMSNSQNPALYGKVCIHGSNGASIGVQTDGGAMFIARMSTIAEPPYNDIWTIPGEEDDLEKNKEEDCAFFNSVDSQFYYHQLQIEDFVTALQEGRKPLVDAREGRRAVELFSAIYESARTGLPVKFPYNGNGLERKLEL